MIYIWLFSQSGTTNPTVKLYYVDLAQVVATKGTVSLTEIEHPIQLDDSERILAAVAFPTESLVSATWMNRVQNKVYFHLCNVDENFAYNTVRIANQLNLSFQDKTKHFLFCLTTRLTKRNVFVCFEYQFFVYYCKTWYLHYHQALAYEEKHGWVDQFEPPHFSNSGSEFLLILPRVQSDNDSWPHLVMVINATTDNPKLRDLTSGSFVVTEIVGWDQDNSLVWVYRSLTISLIASTI